MLTAKEATLNIIISLVAKRVLCTAARDAHSPVACEIVNVSVDITWLHQLGICIRLLRNAAHIALVWVGTRILAVILVLGFIRYTVIG